MAAATAPSSMAAAAGPASAGAASGTQGGQGVVLCPRTLSQVRRTRLRRALTEATAETVNYVKTVGDDDFSLSSPIMRVYRVFQISTPPRRFSVLATLNFNPSD
ncbi:PREDICTED: uncharacterized protein LOC108768695 [Trachymyrmex cornetzi]|uniref:Uncharacterized protein n=1 Tax=Trachymyrmex cornetzi TaxID=471704 RepID=A0A151ITX9_9HYME|nr:PREDICTED: uncharacterized protein LOC108768695 [Trachymyrmex cornetzi]KYN10792.1 hypothetical protein ALC57_17071 [Trachymyrmex cornetzi]